MGAIRQVPVSFLNADLMPLSTIFRESRGKFANTTAGELSVGLAEMFKYSTSLKYRSIRGVTMVVFDILNEWRYVFDVCGSNQLFRRIRFDQNKE